MSYAKVDHAEWVQLQIAPSKRRLSPKAAKSSRGWAAAPDTLSAFQCRAFDILGMTFGGIYNAPISWNAVDWRAGSGIAVPVSDRELATFDFHQLTTLVFLCHEARIRCSVSRHGFGLLLMFHQRKATGDMAERHPSLDEAVAKFRDYLPINHRIIYAGKTTVEAAA